MEQTISKSSLRGSGFFSYLTTLFLGAFNDNLIKFIFLIIAIEMGRGMAADGGDSTVRYALVNFTFMFPFLVFSGYAAYFSDVFSKRRVMISTKIAELGIMIFALITLMAGSFPHMLFALFLMTMQSTVFSPAKYGILPEMLRDEDLSRANGLVELSTKAAIVLGTAAGGFLWKYSEGREWLAGLVPIAIAITGIVVSLRIPKVPASGSHKKFNINPWGEVWQGIGELFKSRPLLYCIIGLSWFWFIAALLYQDMFLLAKNTLHLGPDQTGIMFACMAIGIGLGGLVAGKLSGDIIELGLVPIGGFGVAVSCLLLPGLVAESLLISLVFMLLLYFIIFLLIPRNITFLSLFFVAFVGTLVALLMDPSAYARVSFGLAATGFFSGFFFVPLNAFLQQKAPKKSKGRLLATNAFFSSLTFFVATGFILLTHDVLQYSPVQIIQITGLITLLATLFVISVVPHYLMRLILYIITHTIYSIRILGGEHIPRKGPALLVCNHVSHIDGILVGSCFQRFVRFMLWRNYYNQTWLNPVAKLMGAIPTGGRNRTEVMDSLDQACQALRNGEVVCIFAEGSITRHGNLLQFRKGFKKIAQILSEEGIEVPIVPVHLDRIWGSIFSFKSGRFLTKWPERFPYPVTVSFGEHLPTTTGTQTLRETIQQMGSDAIRHRMGDEDLLHLGFIRTAKRHRFDFCMADSSGKEMNYIETLVACRLFAKWVREELPDDEMVGTILPASIGGALSNIALMMAGKVPVNLNFTAGAEAMQSAIEQCKIKNILTSRKFIKKANIEQTQQMIFLEDVLTKFKKSDKVFAMISSLVLPTWWLQRKYNPKRWGIDDLATIIFSSGSTGMPKGVMLSHYNIAANVDGIGQAFWVSNEDRVMGVLPFFHSFGFTGTLWLPLLTGMGVVYHPNPVDAKTIGQLVEKFNATVLIATPTFFQTYTRRCTKEQFSSLRICVVGAEKLRAKLAEQFREKFGMELLEGYGATEMAPVVSVNVPDVQHGVVKQTGTKFGTVGHPLPGVSAKIVNPDTGEALGYNEEGLLLLKGPNRMQGYLNLEEKTRLAFDGEWYVTGDIAKIDSDGFIEITDRLSRFSKIGGEMVPHIKVEDAINEILGEPACAITSLPDEQKGERLIVFYTKEIPAAEITKQLKESDLPKLWIPRKDAFKQIDELPLLGSGKLDLKGIKKMAQGL